MSQSPSQNYPLDRFDYQLLDTGSFQKLEQFGPHRFIRPAPQAIWPKSLSSDEWKKAEGEYKYFKGKETGGEWKLFTQLPKNGWEIKFHQLTFKIQPTGFGHIGIFPEQAANWLWVIDQLKQLNGTKIQVLNVFGYTGASTLAAAYGGAHVTHVDASKGSVNWARHNLEISGLGDRPVRWIVDDAMKYMQREHRRGKRYDAIIMDPPSFGRGPKGEVWNIENKLSEFMEACQNILSDSPAFLLLTTHSPGFSALTLENMMRTYLPSHKKGTFETGEMFIPDQSSGLNLPNGFSVRWLSSERG
ncbi:MAG: class I SAM-dependent methyltransferase [Nitrospinaceae bacterium]|jgi:23S rRNA (cytosine1962-C5)-methyltransferase